ncbi:MAG TPA: hypothetical protein VLF89_06575 [Candidatus Saccharimonadales bacterium]|nr:hypothetical protein [Candidatus Saccharimonadales bacterium]
MTELHKSDFRLGIEQAFVDTLQIADRSFAQPNSALFESVIGARSSIDHREALPYQEEFLPTEYLAGRDNVIFLTEEQIDSFTKRLTRANMHIAVVNEATGLSFDPLKQPMIINYDSHIQRVNLLKTMRRYKEEPEIIGTLGALLHNSSLVAVNQMGRFHTDILNNIGNGFPKMKIDERYSERINNSLFFVDKTNYINLRNSIHSIDLPSIAPSVVVSAIELTSMPSFQKLQTFVQENFGQNSLDRGIVIKIGLDSGGEGVFIVTEKNFHHVQKTLQQDASSFQQHSNGQLLQCIVQEKVILPPFSEIPLRTSVDFVITSPNDIQIVGTAGQISSDEDRTQYIGSLWSQEDDATVIQNIGEQALKNQAILIAKQGYSGPLGFDYMLDGEKNNYVDIGDLNPRDTANILVYNMRNRLRRMDQQIRSIANIGRSGLFHTESLMDLLRILYDENIIYTTKSEKGIILLPHLNGGYNPFFVNYESTREINTWIQQLQQLDESFPRVYI